jgi:hypothetical protein
MLLPLQGGGWVGDGLGGGGKRLDSVMSFPPPLFPLPPGEGKSDFLRVRLEMMLEKKCFKVYMLYVILEP